MTLSRQVAFNAASVLLSAGSAMALSVLAARSLGPEAMGHYTWLAWLLAMGAILVNLGGITTTLKHLAEASGRGDREQAAAVLAHGLDRWARNATTVTVLWLLAAPLFWNSPDRPVAGWLIAGGALTPITLFALLTGACQGIGRQDRVARATGLGALAAVSASGIAAGAGLGVPGLMAAQGLSGWVGCAVLIHTLRDWHPGWRRSRPSADLAAALGAYGGPVALVVVIDAIVWQRSGVLFLDRFCAPAEVACFALAFALAQMAMRAAPGTLVGMLLPAMARARGAGDLASVVTLYRRSGRWLALASAPMAVLGAWCSPAIVGALYGEGYEAAAAPLALLLAAGAASMCFGFPASSLLYAMDGHAGLLRVGATGAAAYILAASWLIPGGGAWEAALATCLAQGLCLGAGVLLTARTLPGAWPDLKGMVATLGLAVSMVVPLAACKLALPDPFGLPAGVGLALLWFASAAWWLPVLCLEDRARIQRHVRRILPGL